jgi:hypothetical protein
MKRLDRIKKRLISNRGELLAETLVSMILLVLLLAIVTSVIQQSLAMINRSIQRGREIQENEVNPAILIEYRNPSTTSTFSITIAGISTSHSIYFDDGDMVAFSPEVP